MNDHDALREDLVVQTACGRDRNLASSSTLCRFERRAERRWAIAIHRELIEQFIVLGALDRADESSTHAEFEQLGFVTELFFARNMKAPVRIFPNCGVFGIERCGHS